MIDDETACSAQGFFGRAEREGKPMPIYMENVQITSFLFFYILLKATLKYV